MTIQLLPRHCVAGLVIGMTTLFTGVLGVSRGIAQETEPAANGPWLSSVAWMGDSEIVAAKSQGLLLRPAEVVKIGTSNPDEMATLGESETSLWKVLTLDGRVLATDYKGGVHIFGDGEPATVDCQARWIRALSLTPAEGEVLAGTEDGKLLLLSVDSREEQKRIDAHEAAIFDIAFSPDGNTVATAGGDGKIKLFRWPELEPLGEMSRRTDAIWSLVFSDDGSMIVSGGADRRIQLWDVQKKESVCTIAMTGDWITDLVTLPETHIVVAACMDGKLVAADYDLMTKIGSMEGAKSAIWSLALSPDGSQFAVGTRKHGLQILDVPSWKETAEQLAGELAQVRPPAPEAE